MEKQSKWSIKSATDSIERNGGKISITEGNGKTIKLIKISEPGIKVLGAMDFLINHCGYRRIADES